jgi:hypothetical protein
VIGNRHDKRGGGAVFAAATLAVLAISAGVATGAVAPRAGVPSGVGPVKLGMKRGPLRNAKGRPIRTVTSALGSSNNDSEIEHVPFSESASVPFVPIYQAEYASAGLTVYYQRVGSITASHTGPKDKVLGVVTFKPSAGLPIGQTFPDGNCVPFDRREAPGGGPPRVTACFVHGGSSSEILYMDPTPTTRAEQTVAGAGIFTPKLEEFIHIGMLDESKEGRDCETISCE